MNALYGHQDECGRWREVPVKLRFRRALFSTTGSADKVLWDPIG